VLNQALSFKADDKAVFQIRSLVGEVKEFRGDNSGAISEYEAARKACNACNEKGQQIAFFNLGFAYFKAQKKPEALQQLLKFKTSVCDGSLKNKYTDECAQAQEILKQLQGT